MSRVCVIKTKAPTGLTRLHPRLGTLTQCVARSTRLAGNNSSSQLRAAWHDQVTLVQPTGNRRSPRGVVKKMSRNKATLTGKNTRPVGTSRILPHTRATQNDPSLQTERYKAGLAMHRSWFTQPQAGRAVQTGRSHSQAAGMKHLRPPVLINTWVRVRATGLCGTSQRLLLMHLLGALRYPTHTLRSGEKHLLPTTLQCSTNLDTNLDTRSTHTSRTQTGMGE